MNSYGEICLHCPDFVTPESLNLPSPSGQKNTKQVCRHSGKPIQVHIWKPGINGAPGDHAPLCPVPGRMPPRDQLDAATPPPPPPIQPVPRNQWPAFIRLIAMRYRIGDRGVGSTFKREIGLVGVAWIAILEAAGMPCSSCQRREEQWDLLYKYEE